MESVVSHLSPRLDKNIIRLMMNVVIKHTCDKIQVFIFSIMLMLEDKPSYSRQCPPQWFSQARAQLLHFSMSSCLTDGAAPGCGCQVRAYTGPRSYWDDDNKTTIGKWKLSWVIVNTNGESINDWKFLKNDQECVHFISKLLLLTTVVKSVLYLSRGLKTNTQTHSVSRNKV